MTLESIDGNHFPDSCSSSSLKDQTDRGDRSWPRSSTTQFRVLVIDDSESILVVLEEGLACFGQKVFAAPNGREGLKLFRNHSIDAVVCDLAMPDISGLQVAELIRSTCLQRGVSKPPFILLTGWGEDDDLKDRMSRHGVDRVMPKPVDLGDLIQVIRELIVGEANSEHRSVQLSRSSR